MLFILAKFFIHAFASLPIRGINLPYLKKRVSRINFTYYKVAKKIIMFYSHMPKLAQGLTDSRKIYSHISPPLLDRTYPHEFDA